MKRILPLLAAFAGLVCGARAVVPPPDKLLPDDTLAMFSVPDFAKARDVYGHSPQFQLWQDPALKPFRDKFTAKFKDRFLAPLEHDLGIHFDDYTNLPQGQLTLAVTQNGWSGETSSQTPALLFLLDTRDKSSQLKTNLADLRKKWVDAGKTLRTEKIRDIDFSVITISTNDLPKSLRNSPSAPSDSNAPEPMDNPDAKKPAVKQEFYVGQIDSLLVIGNSPKAIEKIAAKLAGADLKTLSDSPGYAANEAVFHDAVALGWVNTKALIDAFLHAQSESSDADAGNPLGLRPAKILSALGLDGLKSVALSYRFSDDGALGTLALNVPEANRAGLFKILAGAGKEVAPPPFVPADAVKFQRWRIDGQKAWATLQSMVNAVSPQANSYVDFALNTAEAAAKEKDPNFDIRKMLFGNLGDDFISYSKAPKGDTVEDLNSAPWLFLIGSPNADQLASGLKSLLPLVQAGGVAEREFLGHKIYSIPLPLPSAKGTSAAPQSLSYSYSGNYLALTITPATLEEYLRSGQSDAKSLRDMAGLGDAIQKVTPGNASFLGFSNDSESMRTSLAALKKAFADDGASVTPLTAMMGGNADKLKEWFDISLLPDFDQVAKYFSFSVYGETATADGLVFKGFTPVPPQLKKSTN